MYVDDLWTLLSTTLGIPEHLIGPLNQQNCWAIPAKNVDCKGQLIGWCRDCKTSLSPTCLLETSCKDNEQFLKLVVKTMFRNLPLFTCCAVFAHSRTWSSYSLTFRKASMEGLEVCSLKRKRVLVFDQDEGSWKLCWVIFKQLPGKQANMSDQGGVHPWLWSQQTWPLALVGKTVGFWMSPFFLCLLFEYLLPLS